MSKIEQWARDKEDHKSQQRAAFPISENKPRKKHFVKSPYRSSMTSQLMATTYRYRVTTAATLLRYFQLKGERPNTISQVLRLALESMEDMVVTANPECKFELEHDALQFLQNNGIMNSLSPANQKRIIGNLTLENIKEDGFSSSLSNEFTKGIDIKALAKEIDAKARPRDISTTPAAE